VSCLIAMSITLARQVDAKLHLGLSLADLEAWLAHYHLDSQIDAIRRTTSPNRIDASIDRLLKSKAPFLFEPYRKYYPGVPQDLM
jgi:hypothetical protein